MDEIMKDHIHHNTARQSPIPCLVQLAMKMLVQCSTTQGIGLQFYLITLHLYKQKGQKCTGNLKRTNP
jgi:hypothetical protein